MATQSDYQEILKLMEDKGLYPIDLMAYATALDAVSFASTVIKEEGAKNTGADLVVGILESETEMEQEDGDLIDQTYRRAIELTQEFNLQVEA